MKNPKQFMRSNILALMPYSTARDEYQGEIGIYLDANENPYDQRVYNRYPDPHQIELKKVISEIKQLPVENIFLGNGSDEPIDLVFRLFCTPAVDNVVSITPSYGMYSVAAAINDVEFREVQLESDFSLSTKKLFAACDAKTKAIFLCSPNNPTGNDIPRKQLEEIVNNFEGIVVIDEAYIDFSTQQSMITEIEKHPNLIVLQTLSKAWGMANLRLGIAMSCAETVDMLSRIKYPYNINGLTQKVVMEKLTQDISAEIQEINSERERLMKAFESMEIIKQVYPSSSNFVLVKVDNPDALYNTLIEAKIIVRNRNKVTGCAGCLRITVGTPEQNNALLSILANESKSL